MTIWQMDTLWSERRIGEIYQDAMRTDLTLMQHIINNDPLSEDEYTMLVQHGLLLGGRPPESASLCELLPVRLSSHAIRTKLLTLAGDVYTRNHDALETLRKPYADVLLSDTPPHLRRQREYLLQDVYHGHWFIAHCLHTLVELQLLRRPSEAERTALHTIIMTE
ncbi:MAG: hypothetical protein IJZ74_00780 [Clostridia bacterium]|nr:hypothetical protein [Clostridia bacterium]